MDKWNPTANQLEGSNVSSYIVVHALVHVLKQCGDDLSRENIMRQAANIKDLEVPLLLPGIKVNTSPTNFYPIRSEQLARFEGDHWTLFGNLISADAS
jgi:branched-chain amino acid transport system substrate-binding protein